MRPRAGPLGLGAGSSPCEGPGGPGGGRPLPESAVSRVPGLRSLGPEGVVGHVSAYRPPHGCRNTKFRRVERDERAPPEVAGGARKRRGAGGSTAWERTCGASAEISGDWARPIGQACPRPPGRTGGHGASGAGPLAPETTPGGGRPPPAFSPRRAPPPRTLKAPTIPDHERPSTAMISATCSVAAPAMAVGGRPSQARPVAATGGAPKAQRRVVARAAEAEVDDAVAKQKEELSEMLNRCDLWSCGLRRGGAGGPRPPCGGSGPRRLRL